MFRALLLKAADSPGLRDFAMRRGFVRRAVRRFMPGEDLEAALRAAEQLEREQLGSVLTLLGENLSTAEEADRVTAHYMDALERIHASRLDAHISVKLTQLGLDQGRDGCEARLRRLADCAAALGNMVWIDMESSRYVDVTLDLYKRLRQEFANTGVCVQAYLYRTAADVDSLLGIGASIRLVKGAYREPPSIAMPSKADVDRNYVALAERILAGGMEPRDGRFGLATHDRAIIRRIEARLQGPSPARVEFQMLYAIQREEQLRLARDGRRVRVLISYGTAWFAWYMRRLAERPANIWFVLKNLG
jgi:proline dehydrogenase